MRSKLGILRTEILMSYLFFLGGLLVLNVTALRSGVVVLLLAWMLHVQHSSRHGRQCRRSHVLVDVYARRKVCCLDVSQEEVHGASLIWFSWERNVGRRVNSPKEFIRCTVQLKMVLHKSGFLNVSSVTQGIRKV